MSHPDQHFGSETFSQHGEDLMILNMCKLMGLERPSYVDIGAHHPWNISNTALLYGLGSRGINVEANPELMQSFRHFRDRDLNLNFGIGPKSGILPFYQYDAFSGLNGFKKMPYHKSQIDVDVMTINQLIKGYCDNVWPDILFMDCEGFDLEILQSADFTKSKPKIICAELTNMEGPLAKHLLALNGYYCHARMMANLIFVSVKDYAVLH